MNPSLTPERTVQIQRLFDEVVELAPDARAVHLDQACPDDPDLRQRVEALLDAFNDRAEGVRHVLEQLPLAPRPTLPPAKPSRTTPTVLPTAR